VRRELNEPGDVQPTATQVLVTVGVGVARGLERDMIGRIRWIIIRDAAR
jgi:hypothetical protein